MCILAETEDSSLMGRQQECRRCLASCKSISCTRGLDSKKQHTKRGITPSISLLLSLSLRLPDRRQESHCRCLAFAVFRIACMTAINGLPLLLLPFRHCNLASLPLPLTCSAAGVCVSSRDWNDSLSLSLLLLEKRAAPVWTDLERRKKSLSKHRLRSHHHTTSSLGTTQCWM